MTLILTVANSRGVYQSSDYQLTDQTTGALVSDRAGSKQLRVKFKELNLFLAFTGVAIWRVGSGTQRTVDWLCTELKAVPVKSDLWAICRALTKKIENCCGSRGELTLVLSVAPVGGPFRVATISNVVWERKQKRLDPFFHIEIRTVQKPFHLISGWRDCVSHSEKVLLKALARKMHATPKEVMDALAEINATAARNSKGYVSEGCWVTAQFTDGRDRKFATRNVGDQDGSIAELALGMDLTDFIKKIFSAVPGKELRPVQSVGSILAPRAEAPMLKPEGEPKSFLMSGPTVVGKLKSPSGRHCASIEIGPISATVTARRNELVAIPFAPIR
jgi:hypothetical protein